MAYIPTTSFKEFLVEINREKHSYGNLIMMSIPAIKISYNLEISFAVHAKVARRLVISSGDVTIKTNERCSSKNWPHNAM